MSQAEAKRIEDALLKDVNLRLAPRPELAELVCAARLRRFAKGEYVFAEGDAADDYCLVESGRVVLSRQSPSGKVFTHLVAVPGVPLNAVTCFKGQRRFFSARVADAATVVSIPCNVFARWVSAHPPVALGILRTMGDMLDGAYARIVGLIDESAEERVVNALCMLSSRLGPELGLTNSDVAQMAGVTRETAARIVSRLHEDGLIAKSRAVVRILDQDRLDALATSPRFIL